MRPALSHQSDIDRELLVSGGEFTRAVQRIDQPILRRRRRDATARDFLLCDDGDGGGRLAQPGDDDRLRGGIGHRHRGGILLTLHVEAPRAHGEDRLACPQREPRGEFQKIVVGHRAVIQAGRSPRNAHT